MAKKEERFVKTFEEGSAAFGVQRTIFVDKQTGVNYLWVASGYAGGLTPLLDAMGHPIVTAVPREDRDE